MNRRAFLKLFAGGVAIVAIPIPKFLLPKEDTITITIPDHGPEYYYQIYRSPVGGGTLTPVMIEEAAMRSAQNMGKPDMIMMSEKAYDQVESYFRYKIVYE